MKTHNDNFHMQKRQRNCLYSTASKNIHARVSSVRSSLPEMFCGKRVPKNFVRLAEKNLCQNLFFKVAGAAFFLKNTFGGCFYSVCYQQGHWNKFGYYWHWVKILNRKYKRIRCKTTETARKKTWKGEERLSPKP